MGASKAVRQRGGAEPGTQAFSVAGTRSGTGIVLGVLVALLILFFWMHFFVAQDNESTGRMIQAQTAELARIERVNMALRRQVAATYAEAGMAERARALGYRPQPPLYVVDDQPLAPATSGSRLDAPFEPSIFRDVPAVGSNPEIDANALREAAVEGSSAETGQP